MFDSIDLSTSFFESALRLLLAVACGAVLGWDREAHGREAGLRTHIMVALGAAGFTLVAVEMYEALIKVDVASGGQAVRIVSAIIGGIGFLGAGAILHSGHRVHGLTTAAGLWVVAAIGISAGAGYYSNALLVTGLGFFTLVVLRRLEPRLRHRQDRSETEPPEDRPQ
jgi:putative Mg2+ transporter-C (MgtC) family protein